MNIVVFIKQVPDTDDVKWTENNNIDRTNTESVLNPLDKQALTAALDLKNKYDATKITAISMGPLKAIEVLKEAIALGVDDAILLSDSKFVGSDTCATSKVLVSALEKKIPDTDIIIFGQSASDGETAQTGACTAVRLNYPFAMYVNEILDIKDNAITVNSETEVQKITYKMALPAVICVNNYVRKPELPTITGYIRAFDYNYKVYNMYELGLSETQTGIKGSPTYVSKVYKSQEYRNCRFLNTDELLKKIKEVC